MKFMKKAAVMALILLAVAAFSFRSKIFGSGHTPAITDENGTVLPDSIAALEKISLGGMDQWILMRGRDTGNPVLLWLHGGPGSSQMPAAHVCDTELEKEFIVVQWDQRGAGKSNPPDFDENTMSYDQFIADTRQLTEYLKDRFGREKIYILGHSWGTQPGIEAAGRYPGDYYAYIGVSQVVSNEMSHIIGREWLADQIRQEDKKKDLEKLEALGTPPYTDHDDFVTFIRMVDAYGGSFDLPFSRLAWIALRSPEYTFRDMLAWMNGANRGSGQMWSEKSYSSFDAAAKYPELRVPVYFFQGRNDYNTPLEATETYYRNLVDSAGKHLIVFEDSAHTPFLAEPEKFVRELIKVKEATWR
ncbi:MAG: alpha/beta fold hydrolase [Sediminispirochaetaceae bacterium]